MQCYEQKGHASEGMQMCSHGGGQHASSPGKWLHVVSKPVPSGTLAHRICCCTLHTPIPSQTLAQQPPFSLSYALCSVSPSLSSLLSRLPNRESPLDPLPSPRRVVSGPSRPPAYLHPLTAAPLPELILPLPLPLPLLLLLLLLLPRRWQWQ